jgi:hypothetical protein
LLALSAGATLLVLFVGPPLAADNRPPAPPAKVGGVMPPGVGVPDPQIAVGRTAIAAIDTTNIVFLDKNTRQQIPSFIDNNGEGETRNIFKSLYKKLDVAVNLPKDLCDLNDSTKHNPGCVSDRPDPTYDARIVYDDTRHRFWLASGVRPYLTTCVFGYIVGVKEVIIGKDGKEDDFCNLALSQDLVHRFIAVAVTQEDLTKPPFTYVLVDHQGLHGDWPQITVSNDYLVINRHAANPIDIFNAVDLAAGKDAGTALKVKPLKEVAYADLVAGLTPVGPFSWTPTDSIKLVNNRGPSDGMTYMFGFSGNMLLVFAVQAPKGHPTGVPRLLKGAVVALKKPIDAVPTNGVFRDGKLYIAGSDCASTDAHGTCVRYSGRIIRVPVGPTADGSAVHADQSSGEFLDFTVTDDRSSALSIENAMIDVTKDQDMVLGFQSVNLDPKHPSPAAIDYAVFYHGKGDISRVGILLGAQGKGASPADPEHGGVDLGGIAVDPSDERTVWISHAVSDNGAYVQGIGAVKP